MTRNTMRAMQENDFVIQELTLYLDTHPEDNTAMKHLNYHLSRRPSLKNAVENENGPLTNYDNDVNEWQWVNNPWPWDKED